MPIIKNFCIPIYNYQLSYSYSYLKVVSRYKNIPLSISPVYFSFIRSFSISVPHRNEEDDVKKVPKVLYKNIYEGRGVPNPEPFWVKSNGCPISIFGAS